MIHLNFYFVPLTDKYLFQITHLYTEHTYVSSSYPQITVTVHQISD